MDAERIGSFRTRTAGDGSLEIWAPGWRLESTLYALIPAGLAVGFVLAPMPMPMRAGGALLLLASCLVVLRMTKPGLLLSPEAVTIVGVARRRRVPWEEFSGFMGERRHDEGRVLLVLSDGERTPLPGTLDPSELDPYGEEGEVLSAVDQLNRLGERVRAGDLAPATMPSSGPPSSPEPIHVPAPPETSGPDERSDRRQRRAERKELREALKAVRLGPDGTVATAPTPASAERRRPWRRRPEPEEELTRVAISEADRPAEAEPPARPPRKPAREPAALPSYFPKPVYIPQEEYARMLREQRAAERAAVVAAKELRELAEGEEPATTEGLTDRAP
jgi:PH (Pleckstrin Homology) domain-containing protein